MPRAAGKQLQLSHSIYQGLKRFILEDMEKERKRVAAGSYFRGSWTDSCDRKLYYLRTGTKATNPFPESIFCKMKKGDYLHDHVRADLINEYSREYRVEHWQPEMQLEMEYEVDLENGSVPVTLIGHPDGIIWKGKNKKPWALLEVKTTASFAYTKTKGLALADPEHYSYGYFLQANRYAHMWNALHPQQAVNKVCIVLYDCDGNEDKDTGLPCRDWLFEIDTHEFARDLRRLAKVEQHVKTNKPSERGYENPSGWQCQKCAYLERCWPDRKRRKPAAPRDPEAPKFLPAPGDPTPDRPLPGRPGATSRRTR